ncbi:hypothetical protein, partial [Brevibacterium marinum]|uniref:hypothetical protein n=1 Tax=Brevibacterium marinum TaxID=418643 RepID=UPI0031D4640F
MISPSDFICGPGPSRGDADRLDTVIISEKRFGAVPLSQGLLRESDGQKIWPPLGSSTGQEWAILLSAYGQFSMAAN